MRNIEIFKAVSALAMADLYASFPLTKNLKSGELAIRLNDDLWDKSLVPDERQPRVSNYVREHSPAAISAPTIRWLASAGLIEYKSEREGTFTGVVLTAKGLESIEAKAGRGKKLLKLAQSVLVDASKDAAKKELVDVFSEILKWSIYAGPSLVQAISRA
jgi:hypothetical protein